MSVASMTGAMAAMALPPQMPVPALMRLLVFQFSPSAFPIKYPRPKHVASVNSITVSEKRPTESTVRMFRLAPSRMIANFRIFFEVNLIPGAVTAVGFRKWLMIMPRNSAITDAPMKCSPAAFSSASSPLAAAASTSAIAIPGRYFMTFFIERTPFSFCVFILSPHCDKIKS